VPVLLEAADPARAPAAGPAASGERRLGLRRAASGGWACGERRSRSAD
jgi:hypothetical protein